MTNKDLEGSSELYIKHSTRILYAIGFVALVLFLVLIFYFVPDVRDLFKGKSQASGVASAVPELRPSTNPYDVTQPDKIEFTVGEMGLKASPSFVYKYMVPLNTTSEETVVLTAEHGTIRLAGTRWSQTDVADNFQVESVANADNQMPACAADLVLHIGESCQFKVVWTPKTKAILSNDLLITWSEDTPMAPQQTFVLRVSESSWDSQDCVCCPDAQGPKTTKDEEFNVWRAGEKIKDIIAPERVAIALDGRVLGVIQDNEVIDAGRKKVGRILPDATIVDDQLNVLGAAVNVLPVMNAKGEIIGEIKQDNAEFVRALDRDGQMVGYVLPDGSVVNDQQLVGVVMPWGLVINYAEPASLIGVTMKDGSVIDTKAGKPIGRVLPSGFVISDRGSIIGGVVPKGIPMADGCQSLGQVLPTGEIINEYQQQTGFVTPYGLVMDMNAIPQGRVVRQGLVFNEDGPVAELNPQGRITLSDGTTACITSDGELKNGGYVTGGVLKQGRVIGYDLQVQGITFPDGGVYSARGARIGTVQPSGRVIGSNDRVMGAVIPKTTAIGPACQLLGLVDINGQVVDTQAQLVGIMNPDGQVIGGDKTVIGKVTPIGALVDLGQDGKGIVGTDGYVHTSAGKVIGCVSGFNTNQLMGPVMSIEGQVLGYYESGMWAKNLQGDILGRVLPDRTVLAADTGKVIGAVIAAGHPVIDLEGKVIATVRSDGQVVSPTTEEVVGIIRADGLVLNADGIVQGGLMPRGVVKDMTPTPLGFVGDDGSVVNPQGQVIGQVQLNATVVNAQGDVIGAVFDPAQLALGFDGAVLGTLSADGTLQTSNEALKDAYATATGLVIARNGRVVGQTVRYGAVITLDREASAWVSETGEVYNRKKQVIGRVMPDGTVVDAQRQLVAQVIPTGTVTDLSGQFVGNVSADGRVISAYGMDLGAFPYDDRLMNIKDSWVGRLLPVGMVLDAVGKPVGAVRFDAAVLNKAKQSIGTVLPDNRVVNEDQVIGQFVPYGAPVQDEHGRVSGFVCFDGQVRDAKGRVLGVLIGQQVVDESDRVVAYLLPKQGFAMDSQGRVIGHIFPSGSVSSAGEDEAQENTMLPSGEVISPTGQVIGQRAPFGLALGLDDNILGNALQDGRILLSGVSTIDARPDSVLYDKMQRVRGAIRPLGVFVNREGHVVGQTSVSTAVNDLQGEKIGTLLPAGAAFKDTNRLLGLPMPQTAVVDDDAHVVGIIAADGSVISKQQVVGRITEGGVAVQVSEKDSFALMPQIGQAVSGDIGVPMREGVVGFVQSSGRVMDAQKNVVGYVADDGNVMSLQCEIIAATVQRGSIIDAQGIVIGSVGAEGTALRLDGTPLGRLSSDGSVKGSHVLRILGRVVPTGIVTDDSCQVVGQARPDGRVLDGKGSVVGTMQISGEVYSSLGVRLGAIAPQGAIVDTTGSIFGRTLANADAVDAKGTLMGCVLPDGQVLDTAREHVGSVLKRGIVVNTKGRIIGRVKKDGSVVSPDCQNTVIGQALDDGHVVDFKNQVIGAIFDPQQEQILYSEQGNIQGSISADGVVRNVLGMPAFVAMSNGDIQSVEGKLLARVDVSGNMTDMAGQVVALVTSVGFNPEMPNFVCEGGDCHIMPVNTIPATAKEIDCRGQKCFVDLANNLVFDKNNKVVAFLNPDTGAMIYIGDDSPVAQKVDPAKLKRMRDLLREKRASMKRGIMDKITPDKRLLARAKEKKSKSLGGKIVSGWPVNMDHMIMKDKAIPAVLQRSIDSRNVNVPITAVVERHIYAEDGRNIIIPAGSRLIGQAAGGAGTNRVSKVDISWSRLVRPDGGTFHIAAVSGDAQGRGGVAGYLDEQFLARYGKPILQSSLVSAISYLIAVDETRTTNERYGTVTQSDRAEAAQDARRNFIETMQTIFEQMIEESSTVPPVVFIPAGTRLTVFANEDLWLRSEEDDVDDEEKEYGKETKMVRKPEPRYGNSATYAADFDDTDKKEEKRETTSQEKTTDTESYRPGSIEDFYANGSTSGLNAPERVSTPLTTSSKQQKKSQPAFGFF